MMRTLAALLYSLLLYPAFFAIMHLFAIGNPKIRRGIRGRYQTLERARRFAAGLAAGTELYLVHCSSMGEFEHLKPVLKRLRERRPHSRTVTMFFSPSGYENVKSAPGVDLFLYAPFDFAGVVRRLFAILQPSALLVAKYDLWPNQVWTAAELGIPRLLINATMNPEAGRLRPWARWFQRTLYSCLNHILAISERDRDLYARLAPGVPLEVVGDTKFDQAVERREESRAMTVVSAETIGERPVLVAGSTWPEDERHLIPAVRAVRETGIDFLAIICPHEPTADHLAELERQVAGLRAVRYSRLEGAARPDVILIDRIGILANLYALARIAYVGGSFRQNIHNVLEPAAYGVPVLFGPVNANSREAQMLKVTGGGVEVDGSAALTEEMGRLLRDETVRTAAGEAARTVVEGHRGATERMVDAVVRQVIQPAVA